MTSAIHSYLLTLVSADLNLSVLDIARDYRFGLLAALFILTMFYFFLLLRREKAEKVDPVVAASGKSRRWIQKKVADLEKDGEFKGAGDLLMLIDRFEDAAKMYIQGKALGKAAEAFLEMGDKARAAKAYEKRGLPIKGAELYFEAGMMEDAARTYLRAGDHLAAAAALEKARKYSEASDVYRRIDHLRKAGELCFRAGDKLGAAQLLEEAFRREADRLPGEMKPAESRMLAHMAFLIGNFYEQEDKIDEAAAAFESGGHLGEAARLHEKVGRYPLAAQLYLLSGRPFEAAMCEDKSGRKQEAALIRAEAYRERGQYLEAVGHFEIANQPIEAALMYRELGEYAKSARMFERGGDFERAAAEYLKADEKDLAATAYEKAGKHIEAAELYAVIGNPSKHAQMLEAAGKFIESGKVYREAGAIENAIRAFQQVGDDDPEFEQAQLQLGDIFREKGIPKIALQYYRRVLQEKEIDRNSMASYYRMAACMEAVGMFRDALRIYEAIVVIDYHFEDAADRIKFLEERIPATTPRTPSEPSYGSLYGATQAGDADATLVGGDTGTRLRRYEIMEEIGRGGMGIVYKARDTVLDRTVAYKVLPANLREHPQAVKNFFREAKSAARLNHRNIVTVHDAGEEDGNYYIAMEYLRGRTIKQMLNDEGPVPIKAVIFIMGQILQALAYAHGRNIVHRDIKSSNIMWTEDKTVKLMDFGLAKIIEGYRGTQTVMSGTPYYMSPEQTLGGDIDHRTDLYSLGVMLFEMVTGQLPFTDGQAAYHHVHTPAPDPKTIKSDLPESICRIILKMMEKSPDDRYQSADEIIEALKQVANDIKASVDGPEA